MICSVLIPSRARFDRLLLSISSIHQTTFTDQVEVLVKFDTDDQEAIDRQNELLDFPRVRVFFGPRKVGHRNSGYSSLNRYYEALSYLSNGKWIWIFNDDAQINGEGWDKQLSKVPNYGVVVHPEHIQNSVNVTYSRLPCTAFPIVPNSVWLRYQPEQLQDPADYTLHNVLCDQNGWINHYLEGITVIHDRDPDEVLAVHRAL